jgi:hypothetical protein
MPNDIVEKKGERTRVTRIHEEIAAISTECNTGMATCLGNEGLVIDLIRTNLLRNGRTLFDVRLHDGVKETTHSHMTAEEVQAFFAGIKMACGWFTYTVASHVDADGEENVYFSSPSADTDGSEMTAEDADAGSEPDANLYDGFQYEADPEAVAEATGSEVSASEDTEFKQAA